jgi:DNA-binding Xre family transcriptional regulator
VPSENESNTAIVSLRVKEVAQERGLKTPYALMKAMGKPPTTPYRLWEGNVSAIRLDIIGELCRALGCQPGDLFRYTP